MSTFKYRLFRLIPSTLRDILALMRRGEPHENEFKLFIRLNQIKGLFVDVGANWGQSAQSLFTVNQSLNVLSLEPNTRMGWYLFLMFLRHPFRFRYKLTGVGDMNDTIYLNIPQTSRRDLSTNASFEPGEFEKEYVQERLKEYSSENQGEYSFQRRKAKVITLDSLELAPLAIKIDVEGWEIKALTGMENTLQKHHPLLMIELNNREAIFPWLEKRGYQFYRYNEEAQRLDAIDMHADCLNAFCLHPETPAALRQCLTPMSSAD